MNSNLSTKERYLLEDQKTHEQVCIQKYSNYAKQASDPQLKNIFTNIGKTEQEHLNTINQLLQGQVPVMNNQQSGGNTNQQQQQQSQSQQSLSSMQSQSGSTGYQASDKDLCTDMLMTEKYVSSAYNSAIFEFKNPQVRDVLNHIQKEEQQHGQDLFKYMESKGLYSLQ